MSHQYDSSSSLIPPLIVKPSEVDLEAGSIDQPQCRICLENDGKVFYDPFTFLQILNYCLKY